MCSSVNVCLLCRFSGLVMGGLFVVGLVVCGFGGGV